MQQNVIAGPVFGRHLYALNGEIQRWLGRPTLVRLAGAAFVDVAGAAHRLPGTRGRAWHVDAGVGLRIRMPVGGSTLRVDYARGLRDGVDAVTVGWQLPIVASR
jgi:outer membrane translocation and assembly module TamA